MAASTDIKDNVPVVPEDNWGQTGDITVEDTSSGSSEQITYIELKGGSNDVFIAGRGKNTYFRYQADSTGSLAISFTAEGSIVACLYYSTGGKISEHSSNSIGFTSITKENVSSGDRFYLCVNDTYVGELIAEPVNINVAITSTSSGNTSGGSSSESNTPSTTPSDTTFDQYCKVYKEGDLFISNRVEIKNTIVTYEDGTTQEFDLVGEITSTSFGFDEEKKETVESIIIGTNVTSIGKDAFDLWISLSNIDIPSSVTSIGKGAFHSCGISSITIPNSVTSIGNAAFTDSQLRSISIPSSVTSIGGGAFFGCSISSITIPNSVTIIESSLFECCYDLVNINIPNSVTIIEDYAFLDCCSITSITIPNSVTSIGNSAFDGCTRLKTINYPQGLEGYPWGAPYL